MPPREPPGEAGNPGDSGRTRRALHPLPRGLVELYGLLAVLFVLVPEWMAGSALAGLPQGRQGTDLPLSSGAWRRLPELRLATMSLAELRLLARSERIRGYAVLSRDRLTARLLRRLRRRAPRGRPL
ncbi:MAG: hypothetical protein VKI81_01635 [Synechococcaceae cyanobacterium]|nr:hypothetical protein [Synechococcaceae cyanobacterium]